MRPDPLDPSVPSVAAVCVYPTLVGVAADAVAGTGVRSRAWRARSRRGSRPLDLRLTEIRRAVADGADEIDIVLNRSAFLAGRYQEAFEEIVAAKEACGAAHLKTILETGELGTYDQIRRASVLAMAAGSDFIKTSTGKITPAATLPTALCMGEAIRDFRRDTGASSGLKLAGGIRTAKHAWQYLVVVLETLGADWMHPDRLRLGASSLLNDLLLQRPSCAAAATRSRRASPSTEARRAMSDIEPRPPPSASSTRRAPESTAIVSIAPRYELFIGGAGSRPRRRVPADRSTPPPKRCSTEFADAGPTTSTRPCARRATRGPRGPHCPAEDRAKYVYRIARAAARAGARVRGARDARRRQADQGIARRRHPARGRALLLLRGLGRQARVRGRRAASRGRSGSRVRSSRGTSRCSWPRGSSRPRSRPATSAC